MDDRTVTADAAISADELAEFVAVARSFAQEVPGKLWLELDIGNADAIDRSWAGLCEIGFDRCLVSEAAGGTGLPASALPALVEEIATGDGGVAMLLLLSNIALSALPAERLAELGETDRVAFVPAVGAREPGVSLPELAGGKLTGEAAFAVGGFAADGLVMACRTGEGFALALVESGADGVTIERVEDQLALGAARVAKIKLAGAPAIQVGGAAELDHANAVLNAGIAAIARGISRRARAMAQEYAENRYQGGGPIIIHGAVRDMLARMSERELGMPPAPALGGGDTAGTELAIGLARKISVSDAAVATTLDAVQVFGGMGYMRETGAEKLMRDAKYCQVYPRPNWIARDELLELQRERH
jgi:alkylation response protein AidB-like acyl-CoA dehydrogenase